MADRRSGEQLSLAIDPVDRRGGLPRLPQMSPVTGGAPFDDPDWFFEPWWPGAPALAYLEGGHIRLQVGHLADPNAAFPELADIGTAFRDDGLSVQGTLLVLDDDGRPDADLLRHRLAGDLRRLGAGAFVASDLLYLRGRALIGLPYEDRRAQLTRQMRDDDACVLGRGLRGEGTTLAAAAASMGLTEISARHLDARYRPGAADDSWLRLPVTETPAASTRPLLALLQRLPL
ncbi:MAG: hypothetical protein M3N29_09890 [Chloroflexota bacterium]|nr:hypothetical protein [Chloroflexota bacterium]